MKLTPEQVARLHALETSDGVLTPDAVVADARTKQSPLHALFEWDVRKAAAAHWVETARDVIASVKYVYTSNESVIRAPHYVHDPTLSGQGYRSITALKASPEQARESLIYTLEIAAGHIRRACDLAAPLGLSADIDHLLDQVIGLQRTIRPAA